MTFVLHHELQNADAMTCCMIKACTYWRCMMKAWTLMQLSFGHGDAG